MSPLFYPSAQDIIFNTLTTFSYLISYMHTITMSYLLIFLVSVVSSFIPLPPTLSKPPTPSTWTAAVSSQLSPGRHSQTILSFMPPSSLSSCPQHPCSVSSVASGASLSRPPVHRITETVCTSVSPAWKVLRIFPPSLFAVALVFLMKGKKIKFS